MAYLIDVFQSASVCPCAGYRVVRSRNVSIFARYNVRSRSILCRATCPCQRWNLLLLPCQIRKAIVDSENPVHERKADVTSQIMNCPI